MNFLHLLWTLCALGRQSIDLEISQLEDSLKNFAVARSKLNSVARPNELSPLSISPEPQDWLLSKVIPRSRIHFKKPATNTQFLTLKPIGPYRDVVNSLNIALLVSYSDGTLELMLNTGEVLCSYSLNYEPRLIATTANYDEVKFAVVSPEARLEVFEVHMDKLKGNETSTSQIVFEIRLESSDIIHSTAPTSLIYYVKTGKKYWAVGDSAGVLSMHLLNGTLFKQTEIGFGAINSLERFGQTLVFNTNNSVGTINPVTLELQQICAGLSKVEDICIDTVSSSSYVYAISDNQLLMLDTRHQQGNENFCKGKH